MTKISFELTNKNIIDGRLFDIYLSFWHVETMIERYSEIFDFSKIDKKCLFLILLNRYDKEEDENIKKEIYKFICKAINDENYNMIVKKSVLIDIQRIDDDGDTISNERLSVVLDCKNDNVEKYIIDIFKWFDITIDIDKFTKE